MAFRYAIVGSGRQGTAAAYDFAKFGDAAEITMVDVDRIRAEESAQRVNRLAGRDVAAAATANAKEPGTVAKAIRGCDVMVSGVPYFFNLGLAKAAARAGVSMVDFGGNTSLVLEELALDPLFKTAGRTLVPDCGMGPGFNITLSTYAMSLLDDPQHVIVYEGGLPLVRRAPWDYELTFNIEGLTNEYHGEATFIRNGKLEQVPCFTGMETIDTVVGKLEAVVTSGALSTAPSSFLGKLQTLENKTLRYPGHWAKIAAFSDLGLFETKTVNVDGHAVVPRHVFHALFEPQVTPPTIRDVCIERVVALGQKDGKQSQVIVELVDRYDASTGFTAMERLTGWHASIVAHLIARGEIAPGARPVELAVPPPLFVKEARRRGLAITETVGVQAPNKSLPKSRVSNRETATIASIAR